MGLESGDISDIEAEMATLDQPIYALMPDVAGINLKVRQKWLQLFKRDIAVDAVTNGQCRYFQCHLDGQRFRSA